MKTLHKVLIVFTLFILCACKPAPTETQTVNETQVANRSAPAKTEKIDECRLSLGFDVWEPYQYLDVNSEVRGLDTELITAALSNMGCTVTYQQGSWVSLLDGLKDGTVDLLLGASKTEAREQYAYFSDPYRQEEFLLYIRKDDNIHAGLKDINEFIANDSRIGIVGEYYYGPQISNLLDGSATSKRFVPAIIGEMNIARLMDNNIDGFLEDSFVGASILRRKGLKEYITPHGFAINTGDIFVMFSQQSVTEEQVSQFNSALNRIKQNGEFKRILDKYSR